MKDDFLNVECRVFLPGVVMVQCLNQFGDSLWWLLRSV